MKKLSKEEMKKIIGGETKPNYCGSSDPGGCCNVYCGTGSGQKCIGNCGICADAGNGQNPGVPGGDKLCVRFE